jgi:hypothetical protein
VLLWARANGCPWDENTCMGAVKGGHLEILEWLRLNRCPWDESTPVERIHVWDDGGDTAVVTSERHAVGRSDV